MIVRIVAWTAGASAAVAGFYFYGELRAMQETFGFSATSAASSALFTVFLASPLLIVVTIAGLATRKFDPGVPMVVLVAGLFAGCVASEAYLLFDESRFSSEVAALRPGEFHDRGRAWPFQGGLVFIPGKGVHATD